jgi:predicted Zn-dependent peptidase
MKRSCVLFVSILLLFSFSFSQEFKLDVKEHVLSNGLKLLLVVKPEVPRVVCHIYFKAGSVNERPGITGIAHLHEHMMFKGTKMMGVTDYEKDAEIDRKIDALMEKIYREKYWKRDGNPEKIAAWQKEVNELIQAEKQYVIKDELWELYMKNGGTFLNASTSYEITGYYVTLPSNKVELQMLLESDRMQNAYFREFYSEKDVVMEERRLSENRPGYLFNEQVRAAFYTASPYHWGVIGWMDDLKRITKQDIIEFNKKYYTPNNAVAVYVGDFDPNNIIQMAEKYFGRIPKGPDIEPIRTYEPPQYSEKRLYGEGPAASRVTIMFHIPPDGHPDIPALSLLGGILSGETGRLYKSLVKEKDMATRVSGRAGPRWHAGEFTFSGSPKTQKNVTPEDLEKEIWAEIEKVKKDGVTPKELQKIKNGNEASFLRGMQRIEFIAMRIGRSDLNRGWRSLVTNLEEMKKVTVEDIQRVAEKYFVKDNSTTAIYTRKMRKPAQGGRRR